MSEYVCERCDVWVLCSGDAPTDHARAGMYSAFFCGPIRPATEADRLEEWWKEFCGARKREVLDLDLRKVGYSTKRQSS